MKSLHLFKFKGDITTKMPFFNEKYRINSGKAFTSKGILKTEKITEFIIEVSDTFNIKNCRRDEISELCENSDSDFIEHYFINIFDNYDLL